MSNQMFKRYLRRDCGFWRIQSPDPNQTVYCKHNSRHGGVYAYLEEGIPGVRIVTDDNEQHFNNFDALGSYLQRLEETGNNLNGLVRALHRTSQTRMLRNFAL